MRFEQRRVGLALDVELAGCGMGHRDAAAPVGAVADLLQPRDRAGPEPVEHARPVVGLGDAQDHAGLQRLQARYPSASAAAAVM